MLVDSLQSKCYLADEAEHQLYRSGTGTCAARRPGRFWRNFSTFHIWVVFNYIWNRVYAFIPMRTAGGFCQRIHGKSEIVRGRRSGALRRSYFLDPTFLEKILLLSFAPPPPPPPRFSEKRFRGFVRVGDRSNSVRVGAVAEPTSHSLQYRSTSGTPDGSRSTVLQTQFFSRRLRRRTHSKNDQPGSK